MTKADIVEMIYLKHGISKKEAFHLTEEFFEAIKNGLEHEKVVMISGFGKWSVRTKRPRRGRNPQTGTEIEISPRKVVAFKPSPKLRRDLK
jgi:integration host factor subunit alpha